VLYLALIYKGASPTVYSYMAKNSKRTAPDVSPLTKRKATTDERRRRVATQILERVTVENIALAEDVSLTTIFKDKRFLERVWNRELAEDYITLKMREYLALDKWEHEAITRYNETNPTDPKNFLPGEEDMSFQRVAALVAENGRWFDRIVTLIEKRCKLLGLYARADDAHSVVNEDNRQVISITVSPPSPENTEFHNQTKKEIPFGEWAYGVLNPPTEEELNGNGNERAS